MELIRFAAMFFGSPTNSRHLGVLKDEKLVKSKAPSIFYEMVNAHFEVKTF